MAEVPFTLAPDMTLQAAVLHLAQALGAVGIEDPRREARFTLMAALDLSAADLVLRSDQPLGPGCARAVEVCWRRIAREPLARIVGHKEFYGLDFALCDDTLVPRPDTEILVDAVLDQVRLRGLDAGSLTIVDLGTGSGAILAALLQALPQAHGLGVDLSASALDMAQANVRRHCGEGRASFRRGDWLSGLEGPFQIIVSNPPYIETGDIAGLAPELVRHDPVLALDGGPDGLDAYRLIVAQAVERLFANGLLAFELGAGQQEAVTALCVTAGLEIVECRDDLAGIARALIATKPQ